MAVRGGTLAPWQDPRVHTRARTYAHTGESFYLREANRKTWPDIRFRAILIALLTASAFLPRTTTAATVRTRAGMPGARVKAENYCHRKFNQTCPTI